VRDLLRFQRWISILAERPSESWGRQPVRINRQSVDILLPHRLLVANKDLPVHSRQRLAFFLWIFGWLFYTVESSLLSLVSPRVITLLLSAVFA
jgi:hypothetical protein